MFNRRPPTKAKAKGELGWVQVNQAVQPLCRKESTHERESDEIPRNNFAAGYPRATSRLRIGISTRKNDSEVSQHRKISFTLKNTAKPDDFELFRRTPAVQPLFRTDNGSTCPFREPG